MSVVSAPVAASGHNLGIEGRELVSLSDCVCVELVNAKLINDDFCGIS